LLADQGVFASGAVFPVQIDVSITCRTSNVYLGMPGVPPALATGRE
jgi:hypothetical protein